jgi:hypothetical protein
MLGQLSTVFHLASEQFQTGLIKHNVFIQWLRSSRVMSNVYSINLIGNEHMFVAHRFRALN